MQKLKLTKLEKEIENDLLNSAYVSVDKKIVKKVVQSIAAKRETNIDLQAFRDRKREPSISYKQLLKGLTKKGKI